MSAPSEELEIFILTHNRADMLKVAIESCLQQTVKGLSITVLDNASTDHTAQTVAAFDEPNVHLISATENVGGLGNIKRCQQLCSKKYVLIFHDDDQLHPHYIENAYACLQANPDANVVVSNAVTIPAKSEPNFSEAGLQPVLKLDRLHFATALYVRNKIAFSSAIYAKTALKSLDFEDLKDRFGKWGDRPILIEAVADGAAMVFTGAYVFSGRHDAQDTHRRETQPPHTVWLNREKFFRDILGDKLSDFSGICFCVMSRRRLKSGFKRRIRKGVSFSTYLDDAFAIGAASKRTWNLGKLAPRPIQRFIDSHSQRYLRRHFSNSPLRPPNAGE